MQGLNLGIQTTRQTPYNHTTYHVVVLYIVTFLIYCLFIWCRKKGKNVTTERFEPGSSRTKGKCSTTTCALIWWWMILLMDSFNAKRKGLPKVHNSNQTAHWPHITWRHHQLTDGTRPRSNKSKKIVADKEFEPELKPTKHAHYHYTMHLVVEEFGNGMYLNLQI